VEVPLRVQGLGSDPRGSGGREGGCRRFGRPSSEDAKAAQKNVLAAVDEVARRLGNTRDIARSSYISPRVIDHYMEGFVVACYGERLE
jgi:DNA topoisomerase IB